MAIHSRMKTGLAVTAFAGVALAAYLLLRPYLNAATFPQLRETLAAYVGMHPFLAPLAFGLAYAGIVALSLPFASFMTLMAGFLFGLVGGTALVAISATTGAIIIFLLARTALGAPLREKAGPFYARMEEGFKKDAVSYLLFLRLVPLFPFWLVNIVPALFNVHLRTYAWTTLAGILPGTAIYVNLGRSLSDIDKASDLVGPDVLVALALLGAISLLPVLYKKVKARTA